MCVCARLCVGGKGDGGGMGGGWGLGGGAVGGGGGNLGGDSQVPAAWPRRRVPVRDLLFPHAVVFRDP